MTTTALHNRHTTQLQNTSSKGPITTFVEAKGEAFLNDVKPIADDVELDAELAEAMEKFVSKTGGDDYQTVTGTVKLGNMTFYVQSSPHMKHEKITERVGFFSADGGERARVEIATTKEGTAMYWLDRKTGKRDGRIDTPAKFKPAPSAEKKAIEAYVEAKNNANKTIGRSVATKNLPAGVRERFEQMERVIADGARARKFEMAGKTYYELTDTSCVQTSYYISENNEQLCAVCNG